MTPRRTLAAGSVLALGLSLMGGVASAAPQRATGAASGDDFYTTPSPSSLSKLRPGDVLKEETSTPTLGVPVRAQRLMYVSRSARGPRTAVTGTFLTPTAAWTGPGQRPLVTYAVGTQGMGDQCAPSHQFDAGTEYETPFISALLARGYAVVVSDYEGLGTPGTHSYTNSIALGRNVLDAAKAAERLTTDAVPKTAPVIIAGYSEGGNAAAGALQQHATYAKNVPVIGGYAGAVPSDLAAVAANLDGSLYEAFLIYSVKSLEDLYPQLHIDRLLSPAGQAAADAANLTCNDDGVPMFAYKDTSAYTRSGQKLTTLLDRPSITRITDRLELGRTAPDVPVLVAHSVNDDVVPFDQDRDMARSWCAEGADVTFDAGVAPSHVLGAVEGFPKALAFFSQLVAGQTPPGNCGLF